LFTSFFLTVNMRTQKRSLEQAQINVNVRPFKRGNNPPQYGPVVPMEVMQGNRARAINKRLQAMNRASMGFLGIEKKFYDSALVFATLTAPTDCTGGEHDPSATSMISTPTQGDGEQQRDGKQIACDYVEIKGMCATVPTEVLANPPQGCKVFLALILDTQSNGAQMNSEDCFKNFGASASQATTPLRNLLFGRRFRILKSEILDLDAKTIFFVAANVIGTAGSRAIFSWFVPLRGLKINFNAGTTASIANVVDNSLHMIAWCDSADMAPGLSYNARLRFMG